MKRTTSVLAASRPVSSKKKGGPAADDGFEIEYRYDDLGTLARDEVRPIMLMWVGPQSGPAAMHRHALVPYPRAAARHSGFVPVRVRFPHAAGRPLEHDTAVHAVLLSTVKSSQGKITYEKAASTRFHLADLLADHEAGQFEGGDQGSTKGNPRCRWARQPMQIQSYYMPTPGEDRPELVEAERHKGDLHMRLARPPGRRGDLRLPWAKPTGLELTPANVPTLQKAMMSAVARTMAPFRPGGGDTAVEPTMPETLNVHAPLYVQETEVPLDGATFWARAPFVAKEHVNYEGGAKEGELYLELLLQQSMARHDVTTSEFLHAAASFDGRVAKHARAMAPPGGYDPQDPEAHDAAVHRALAVIGTMAPMRGDMTAYVADTVVLSKTGRKTVVESFDQAGIRTANTSDSGGVRSRLLLPPSMARRAAARFGAGGRSEEDDRNVASGGATDCEDAGRDAAVHFTLLKDSGAGVPDEGLTRPIVIAGRAMAQHYRGVGVLCSVLSRNLADARDKTSGAPFEPAGAPIGSAEDERVNVGAHMFLLLMPEATVHASIVRALDAPSRMSRTRPTVDMGAPEPATLRSPLMSGHELPVLLCEGTGVLHPLMRPSEAYESTREGQVRAALKDVVRQEAYVRLATGQSSVEIAARIADHQQPQFVMSPAAAPWGGDEEEGVGPDVPLALEKKFQDMHRNEKIVEHAEERLIETFYRTAAEMYAVPSMAQALQRLRRKAPRGPEQLAPDRLIPLQARRRRRRSGSAGPRTGQTWGVDVTHMIQQRDFVALLPTPEPTPVEARIVDRVHRHMAPTVPLRRDVDPRSDRYIHEASRWPALFTSVSGLPPITDEHRDLALRHNPERYSMVHKYADPRDLSREEVAEVAQWMATVNGRFVKAAGLSLERSTERLATVRLDALVDCGDTAERVREQVEELF